MALTDNIVAYWKLDESSGNAADATGNGNTGVNTSVGFAAGQINNGAVFNAASDNLNVGRLSAIENIGAVTTAGWYKQTTLDTLQVYYSKGGIGNPQSFDLFSYTDGNLYVEINSGSNRAKIDYSAYMSADTWTHIAVVFDGSGATNADKLKIYFNGTQQTLTYEGTIGTVTTTSTGDLTFGAYSGVNGLVGMEDEIGVWSRALTGTEISTLYNSGAGLQYPFTVVGTANLKPNLLTLGVG